jgi:hypothetical protein
LGIGIDELIALKVGINEAVKHYNLSPLTATLQLINDIKKYNKINGLKKELSALNFQKYAISQFCSSYSDAIMALVKLRTYGVTEDQILLYVNRILEEKSHKIISLEASANLSFDKNKCL